MCDVKLLWAEMIFLFWLAAAGNSSELKRIDSQVQSKSSLTRLLYGSRFLHMSELWQCECVSYSVFNKQLYVMSLHFSDKWLCAFANVNKMQQDENNTKNVDYNHVM